MRFIIIKRKLISMLNMLKKFVKKIISYPDKSPSKHIFQELTYGEYDQNPDLLDEYLCNLYSPKHSIKFFSFRKFFKLPSTYEFYIRNINNFYPTFKINSNDIVIDIGAHHGIFSINTAKLGAEVHCFEPNPMSYVILKKNIENNDFKKKLITVNSAVSSANNQKVPFDIGVRSTAGSIEKLKDKVLRSGDIIEVNTINLNEYIRKIPQKKIKILKMDCEGAEHMILDNFEEIKRIEFLIIEAHETENNTPLDIIKKLKDLKYEVNQVKANHGAVELYCKLN